MREPPVRSTFDQHLESCTPCAQYLALSRRTNCRDLADFLSEYIEARLPIAQKVVFESHLSSCPPCLDYMRSLRATIVAGQKACEGEVPMPEKLVKAILKARKQA